MRSKDWKVDEMLDFQGIEGIGGLLEEPRKVSQNYVFALYNAKNCSIDVVFCGIL